MPWHISTVCYHACTMMFVYYISVKTYKIWVSIINFFIKNLNSAKNNIVLIFLERQTLKSSYLHQQISSFMTATMRCMFVLLQLWCYSTWAIYIFNFKSHKTFRFLWWIYTTVSSICMISVQRSTCFWNHQLLFPWFDCGQHNPSCYDRVSNFTHLRTLKVSLLH